MKTSLGRICVTTFCMAGLFLFISQSLSAQQSGPQVIPEDHHDTTSLPLRSMNQISPLSGQQVTIPVRRTGPADTTTQTDSVRQSSMAGALVATTPGLSFDGIAADGFAPPDPNASVGASQVVETVNVEYAIYNKSTGALVLGPAQINSIWAGFGGVCQTGPNYSDPIVLYDKAAGRWLITQIASTNGFASGTECIAVSTTSDATGSYNRYAFSFGSNLNDYPKFGVWPDAYYASYNMFQNGASFIGAQACAYNRSAMLAGNTSSAVCFQKTSSDATLLPSDLDGAAAPPAGEPNFYLDLGSSSSLKLYKFHVDFTTPSNSTFSGPTTIPVAAYSQACGGGTCIPQAGVSNLLDSLGDRLMFRLAYRNFGGHESLVVNHSITSGSSVGPRWYEIRSPNSTPVLYQQGTFAPDSTYRWMGSIAMDQAGDIALGYSASSSSIHPSIRYTGRVPSDSLGTMEAENTVLTGSGSQSGLSRWGDYTSMSVDPSDDCTFWYTNEYEPSTGSFNWTTHIASFKFSSCTSGSGFRLTGSMNTQRYVHTATQLSSGKVLVAGGRNGAGSDNASAELYDPSSGAFAFTGNMNTGRDLHTATRLNNGMVLIVGGEDTNFNYLGTAELYDPASGTFQYTGSLNTARVLHTATLLNNGQVLIVGGVDNTNTTLQSAELYDPATGAFTLTGNLNQARAYHTATLLSSGLVLIAGGAGDTSYADIAELYDPAMGTFSNTGGLNTARADHASALLGNGMVLVAGGYNGGAGGFLSSAELYNPATGTFATTGSMSIAHDFFTATTLSNGMVLMAGGRITVGNAQHPLGTPTADAELYNPSSGTFTVTGSLNTARARHQATLLGNGVVLIEGGEGANTILTSAELFQ